MSNILVHKVPVQVFWTIDENQRAILKYAQIIKAAFPRERHIFLPDDGTGRGDVTMIQCPTRKRGRRTHQRRIVRW